MRTEDLELINEVGTALYAAPEVAESRSVETVAALSTLDRLTAEQSFEHALLALLARAEKEGVQASASGIQYPFYRLSPTERFVLVLLHSGRISYKRLAKIMKMDVMDLQSLAWHARIRLGSQPEVRLAAPHPLGTSHLKHQCPEYDATRPWTQKFLDDEMSGQELMMIQNHTVACDSCRRALTKAREFYYAIETQIPSSNLSPEAVAQAIRRARLKVGTELPSDLTLPEAIRIFLRRREIQVYLLIAAIAIFWIFSRN